jgi:hypothetical protein
MWLIVLILLAVLLFGLGAVIKGAVLFGLILIAASALGAALAGPRYWRR